MHFASQLDLHLVSWCQSAYLGHAIGFPFPSLILCFICKMDLSSVECHTSATPLPPFPPLPLTLVTLYMCYLFNQIVLIIDCVEYNDCLSISKSSVHWVLWVRWVTVEPTQRKMSEFQIALKRTFADSITQTEQCLHFPFTFPIHMYLVCISSFCLSMGGSSAQCRAQYASKWGSQMLHLHSYIQWLKWNAFQMLHDTIQKHTFAQKLKGTPFGNLVLPRYSEMNSEREQAKYPGELSALFANLGHFWGGVTSLPPSCELPQCCHLNTNAHMPTSSVSIAGGVGHFDVCCSCRSHFLSTRGLIQNNIK